MSSFIKDRKHFDPNGEHCVSEGMVALRVTLSSPESVATAVAPLTGVTQCP